MEKTKIWSGQTNLKLKSSLQSGYWTAKSKIANWMKPNSDLQV